MNFKKKLSGLAILVIIIVIVAAYKSNSAPKNIQKLSPKQSVNLYFKSCSNGDTETLKKIIYFAPNTTEAQKQKRVDALNTNNNPEVSVMLGVMGMNFKAKYEKIIDDNTAEVGVICRGLLTGTPLNQVPAYQLILKKEDGAWKYYTNKSHYTLDELGKMIKENPNDHSLYYYYGFRFISENPYKTHRYYKKYYELEPNGFWVTAEFLGRLREYGNIDSFERMMLNCDSPPGNKSGVYTKIGLGFAECKDYKKADYYYKKAEEVLLKYPAPMAEERLMKARKELQLRLEGKYVDLLGN